MGEGRGAWAMAPPRAASVWGWRLLPHPSLPAPASTQAGSPGYQANEATAYFCMAKLFEKNVISWHENFMKFQCHFPKWRSIGTQPHMSTHILSGCFHTAREERRTSDRDHTAWAICLALCSTSSVTPATGFCLHGSEPLEHPLKSPMTQTVCFAVLYPVPYIPAKCKPSPHNDQTQEVKRSRT